jgi:hypothetical protein
MKRYSVGETVKVYWPSEAWHNIPAKIVSVPIGDGYYILRFKKNNGDFYEGGFNYEDLRPICWKPTSDKIPMYETAKLNKLRKFGPVKEYKD